MFDAAEIDVREKTSKNDNSNEHLYSP